MHKHPNVTRDRIRQFIDFQLRENVIKPVADLETKLIIQAFPDEKTARSTKGWKEINRGESWGPAYQEGWYHVTGTVPAPEEGHSLALAYGPDDTALIYKWEAHPMVEGTLWQNNTQIGGLDFGHRFFRLPEDTKKLDLLVQTFAHNKETTVHRPEKPRTPEPETFEGFRIVALADDLLNLFYDAEFTFDLMLGHEESDPIYVTLMRGLNDVCNTYDPEKPRSIAKCRRIIKDALDSLAVELKHTVYPLGHAHLDTAWLWPLAVTHLKMAHTTAVQLELSERYNEHTFVHSQASQYEWLEKEHPALYVRVKKAIKKGNWEPLGSMWVEADCNLTGSESLVRQFLYGRRYFKEKLGVETIDMFLPDVFGYSAALPQILARFNIQAFLTQKMSWNQFNKIPHNTFYWKGIDGSSIWTHFPPVDTYCANCSPQELLRGVKNHRDKSRSDASLYLYGFGDGGGGPTEFHVERLRRARTAPCLPVIEKNVKARDFYIDAMEESQDLETWQGELYFEYHRGTYTSQAACKQGNRQSEFLLRDAEYLCSFVDPKFKGYPAEELERIWKLVLLNQFHDIIPGSSVKEVYDDAARDYAEIISSVQKVIDKAITTFAKQLDTSDFTNPVAVFHNADLTTQAELVWEGKDVPASIVCQDESLPVQKIDDFGQTKLIFPVPSAAQGTVAVADFTDQEPAQKSRLKASNRKLENDEFAVRFDSNGNITSIQTLDDEPTEFVEPGKLANLFQILDDRPLFWDAWDIDAYSQETVKDLAKSESFEVVENGPVRVAVEVVKKFGKSTIRQRISLGPTPGIRFDTWVDWHESHKMLKVAFPFNVNASRATFEIQYGHVERPTHRNTSWDMARFEVCAQKWADLSDGGHGAAIINTGKYGHDVHNNVLRLSLLRSPKAPDPTCDMGEHHFSYVVFPHFDQVQHSDLIRAAYAINAEPHVVPIEPSKGKIESHQPFVSLDNRAVVVESVKKAEDSDQLLVRMYESLNSRGSAHISLTKPITKAWLCDLDENKLEELTIEDGAARIDFAPFEIITVIAETE